MKSCVLPRFQCFLSRWALLSVLMSFATCQPLWAAQDAIVINERAMVYADELMTSPVGYVRKGKKIKIGDIPRNRAQVYPIIVSGKVAYIRALDVNTEKQSMDSQLLVAERFLKGTRPEIKTSYGLSIFNYSSQVGLSKQNDELKDNSPLNWTGISVFGSALMKERHELEIYFNFMSGKESEEVFRAVEFGGGWGFRLLDLNRFVLKISTQLLAVPFASYALDDLFRVNGYGLSTGAGLNAQIRLGKHWGLLAYGGYYYTKLFSFDPPSPYESINPSFVGSRIGLGLNYQY